MTFKIIVRGVADRPIVAEYLCPSHGRFALTLERDPSGDAPSSASCPTCSELVPWVISAPLARVKPFEAVRGGWQKPERKTWLDTRNLGEGQDVDDWRADREAIRDQERRDSLKELIDG